MSLFILTHAFGFDSLRSKWNAPILIDSLVPGFIPAFRLQSAHDFNQMCFLKPCSSDPEYLECFSDPTIEWLVGEDTTS
jgi:hypothetical protein